MLTGEPALVSSAAALLVEVLEHNEEALPRLYTTGGGLGAWGAAGCCGLLGRLVPLAAGICSGCTLARCCFGPLLLRSHHARPSRWPC
jgi:hypothetical protein